jgi:FAD/FMN-containing dehydrogenase
MTTSADRFSGPVAFPGQEGYDAERAGFDLARPQQPALAVGATGADDVVAAVNWARSQGVGVGVAATGHGIVVPADDGVLINTSRMNAVVIDPSTRSARLQAGVTWDPVIAAAAAHGLAPLCGSSPAVGAVGYTLGGGLGPLGRAYGFAADHVRRIGLVTADGQQIQVSADEHPDLFWGLRGGGGNFGIVTDLEIDLIPLSELYGGGLFFAGELTAEVLAAFLECSAQAPDELSLSVMVMSFPDLPVLPPPLQGLYCCNVRVAFTGTEKDCESLIRPLRRVGPTALDTVRTMPFTEVGTIHNDPTAPQPVHARSLVLRAADAALIPVVVDHAQPTAKSILEVRHLGGALARQPAVPNAVGHRGGGFNVFTSAYAMGGQFEAAEAEQIRLLRDLQPWSAGGALLNFVTGSPVTPDAVRGAFEPADFARLVALKKTWDPQNLFRFNANIPPG